MSQRVRVATISLWGILLLAMGNLELANAPTNPCHHHIDAIYDCSMYYQLSNPFCLCPGQQAVTCSASSTRIYKTTADHGKYHSSQMDTAIRTLRLETSKRGRPNAPWHPNSAGSSQRELDVPIPKELGLPSLEGAMLGSQNRKKESRMAVAERQTREKPTKIEQRKV